MMGRLLKIFMGITLTTNFALAFEDDYAKALSDLKSGQALVLHAKFLASGVKSCDRPNFFVNGLKVKDIQIQASILNDAFPHFMGLQPDEVLDRSTDDMGLTHGYSLSSGFRIGDRSFLNFDFSRDLYTGHDERVRYQRRNSGSDEYVRQQKFTEEGTYLLTLKHFVKNETLYINVGLGMHNLNRGQTEMRSVLRLSKSHGISLMVTSLFKITLVVQKVLIQKVVHLC